jgi:hypothetical protein
VTAVPNRYQVAGGIELNLTFGLLIHIFVERGHEPCSVAEIINLESGFGKSCAGSRAGSGCESVQNPATF